MAAVLSAGPDARTRAQVVFEPEHVEATLKRVVRRLAD